jgi:hypothetical protein
MVSMAPIRAARSSSRALVSGSHGRGQFGAGLGALDRLQRLQRLSGLGGFGGRGGQRLHPRLEFVEAGQQIGVGGDRCGDHHHLATRECLLLVGEGQRGGIERSQAALDDGP